MKYSRNLVTGLILASVCGLGLQPLTVQAADTVVTGDNTQVVGAALYDERTYPAIRLPCLAVRPIIFLLPLR